MAASDGPTGGPHPPRAPVRVVLKFMRHRDQFDREIRARTALPVRMQPTIPPASAATSAATAATAAAAAAAATGLVADAAAPIDVPVIIPTLLMSASVLSSSSSALSSRSAVLSEGLSPDYVVPILRVHDPDTDAAVRAEVRARRLEASPYIIVFVSDRCWSSCNQLECDSWTPLPHLCSRPLTGLSRRSSTTSASRRHGLRRCALTPRCARACRTNTQRFKHDATNAAAAGPARRQAALRGACPSPRARRRALRPEAAQRRAAGPPVQAHRPRRDSERGLGARRPQAQLGVCATRDDCRAALAAPPPLAAQEGRGRRRRRC